MLNLWMLLLLAKGQDFMALKIKRNTAEHDVTIVENHHWPGHFIML